MKIVIDGVEYAVSPDDQTQLLLLLQAHFLQMYDTLDATWRLLLKPIARKILHEMEKKAREQFGNEVALRMRPEKHADPVKHLTSVTMALSQKGLEHVQLSVTTESDHHTIAAFAATIEDQGQGGGQMATNGDLGLWQDDSAEVPGRGLYAALSEHAALHP